MFKRIVGFVVMAFLLANIYGCFLLLAGAAGGAGTAAWLSGKLTQEVSASFETTVKASRAALKSLHIDITKETVEEKVAQFVGKYTDGKTVWIDIRKITDTSSKVEVRVGGVSSDKEASTKILNRIKSYL